MQLGAHDSASLPSLGFADDTAALANTLANLRVQNEWVHYFMRFNCMRLNHTKCELVGRDAAGLPVTAAALAAAGISIEGNALTPVAHDKAIRYLGVHCSFDGSWHAQRLRTLGMLQLFTRVVSKFRVSLSQATYMFNAFLQPKLELALRYVHGPGTTAWLKGCDRTLVGCIKHAVASPFFFFFLIVMAMYSSKRCNRSYKACPTASSECSWRARQEGRIRERAGQGAVEYLSLIHI